jgi:hypothetical protein
MTRTSSYYEITRPKIVHSSGDLKVAPVNIKKDIFKNGKRAILISAKGNPPQGDSIKIEDCSEVKLSGDGKYQIWIKRDSIPRFLECFLASAKSIQWDEFEKCDAIMSLLKSKNKINQGDFEKYLSNPDNFSQIKDYIQNNVTKEDVVAIGYRKEQLGIFDKLLEREEEDINYWEKYRNQQVAELLEKEKNQRDESNNLTKDFKNIKKNKLGITAESRKEAVWQYFFAKNQWIFGYGLDYRFTDSSNREVGIGKGRIDFASFNKFTVLVEIKTPSTPLLKRAAIKDDKEKSPNRSDSWALSNELIDATSQILGYKANWQLECENEKNRQKFGDKYLTADPKLILIIGKFCDLGKNIREENNKKIATETFELFGRNLRNIEIITFDELYERAKYIVVGEQDYS